MSEAEALYKEWYNTPVTYHCWHDGPVTNIRGHVPVFCDVNYKGEKKRVNDLQDFIRYVLEMDK